MSNIWNIPYGQRLSIAQKKFNATRQLYGFEEIKGCLEMVGDTDHTINPPEEITYRHKFICRKPCEVKAYMVSGSGLSKTTTEGQTVICMLEVGDHIWSVN